MPKKSKHVDRIREILKRNPDAKMGDVAAELGVQHRTVSLVARRNGIQFSDGHASDVTKIDVVSPCCGVSRNGVTDSRPGSVGGIPSVRRIRKCRECGKSFQTHELSAVEFERAVNPETVRKQIAERLMKYILAEGEQ